MQRWPELSERKAQHLTQKWAEGANYETINAFFKKFDKLLHDIGICYADDLAERVWNCDDVIQAQLAES